MNPSLSLSPPPQPSPSSLSPLPSSSSSSSSSPPPLLSPPPPSLPYTLTGEKLGNGNYGVVYEGRWNSTNEVVAVKIVKINALKKKMKKSSKRIVSKLIELHTNEIYALNMLKDCDNIVKLMDYSVNEKEIKLVMECCDVDFFRYIVSIESSQIDSNPLTKTTTSPSSSPMLFHHDKVKPVLEELEIQYWTRQLCDAFQAIRSKDIVHRDMKPQNLMLKRKKSHMCHMDNKSDSKADYMNFTLKLIDLGFSKQLTDEELTSTICGTKFFMAPELRKTSFIEKPKYGYKVDLWSIGVIISRMITGYKNDGALDFNRENVLELIVKRYNVSESLIDLLSRLLECDPEKRMNSEEFLNHSFIQCDLPNQINTSVYDSPKIIVDVKSNNYNEKLSAANQQIDVNDPGRILSPSSPSSPSSLLDFGKELCLESDQFQHVKKISGICDNTDGTNNMSNKAQHYIHEDKQQCCHSDYYSYYHVNTLEKAFESITDSLNRYNGRKIFDIKIKKAQSFLVTIYNNDTRNLFMESQALIVTLSKKISGTNICILSNTKVITSFEIDVQFTQEDVKQPVSLEIKLEPETNLVNSICTLFSNLHFKIDITTSKDDDLGFSAVEHL